MIAKIKCKAVIQCNKHRCVKKDSSFLKSNIFPQVSVHFYFGWNTFFPGALDNFSRHFVITDRMGRFHSQSIVHSQSIHFYVSPLEKDNGKEQEK